MTLELVTAHIVIDKANQTFSNQTVCHIFNVTLVVV